MGLIAAICKNNSEALAVCPPVKGMMGPNQREPRSSEKGFAAGLIYWPVSTSLGVAESRMLAPPPCTIVDMTAIMDQQKPDIGRQPDGRAALSRHHCNAED
jgi:hypothetical protein